MPDIQDAKQYAEYQQTVKEFIAREGIEFLSTGCTPLDGAAGEPWFSWRPCEMCDCHLGGDREYLFGCLVGTTEQVRFTICEDCVYYVEYGRLDDTTMARVEGKASA